MIRVPPFAEQWALFLDIDGTLLDIAPTPSSVIVDDALRAMLGTLQAQLGGAIALISGRAVPDIDALFSPLVLQAAGQHGAERRDARGVLHGHGAVDAALRPAAERLRRFMAAHPGLIMEEKGLNLAVHYRDAQHWEAPLDREVRQLLSMLGEGYELQSGKMVLEIKPAGRTKGTAIAEFMQEAPFKGRTPLFIGDDLTDEFGFERVSELGGHAIKVGPGKSAAQWRLPDAPAVRRWLTEFAQFLQAHR
jgi:trehalose 6-phosphate phosphatase